MSTPPSRVRADRGDGEALATLNNRLVDEERCDKCKKFLNGALHEGYMCYDCGLQAHKTCNAPASVHNASLHYASVLEQINKQPLFGLGLCAQFDTSERPAPYVVMRLAQELESRARHLTSFDVYLVYQNSVNDSVKSLKNKLNDDIYCVELNQYDPDIIAAALKTFLWELPDPVIPVSFYPDFVRAAYCGSEAQCVECLFELVDALPEHHHLTLRFLLGHLIRLCQLHHAQENHQAHALLVPIFSLLLLRPPWAEFRDVVHNVPAHVRVLELLLLHGDWGEKLPAAMSAPALPPRKVSRPSPGPDLADLERPAFTLKDAEWYWGDITREEVNEKLNNTPDGTFLVRNASSKGGEFTLTLRKGGTNKLIKICHKNGIYGFSEPYKFTSVVELVNCYRKSSLAQFNAALDIKLKYPVSRFQQDDEFGVTLTVDKLAKKLADITAQHRDKIRAYLKYKEDVNKLDKEIELKQGPTVDAFNELSKMFKDQLEQLEKSRKDAKPHEMKGLQTNCELFKQRINSLEESQTMLEEDLKKQVAYLKTLEREMLNLKCELQDLNKEKDKYVRSLRQKGVKQGHIDNILTPEGLTPWGSRELDLNVDLIPHQMEASWLLMDCSRSEATSLLEGKPDGTFLVRPSTSGPYALSVVCNTAVNHCIIYKTERGFGFAEPYNIYPTLKALVLHYATNSLEEHNEELTTTLMYPVHAMHGTGGARDVNALAVRLGYI